MNSEKPEDNATQNAAPSGGVTPHVHGPHCNHHHPELTPYVRTAPKVGPNEACPCGSGKKYKKCCRS